MQSSLISTTKSLTAFLLYCGMTSSTWACDSLEKISFLLGYWQQWQQDTLLTESWSKTSDYTWEGWGQVQSMKTKKRSVESLRLAQMDGEVFLMAKVSHNELPVAFKATYCDKVKVVFENKEHDFPKQLVYQRVSPTQLMVKVRGDEKGFELLYDLKSSQE